MNHITTCPKCRGQLRDSLHVHERTLVCPHCHAPLSRSDRDLGVPAFGQRDFRRGIRRWWYWIVLGLLSMNLLGIAWTCYAVPSSRHPINDRSILLFLEFAVLDVLVSIFCWIPYERYMSARIVRTVRGVLGFFFLSFGLVIAVVIFFGFICTNYLLP